jgi:transposase-like protein
MEVFIKRERKLILLSQPNLKERGVIMDNNKVLLSNLKYYPKMKKLLKIQEELANNKVIKEAKANNKKCESYTAINPII